MVDADGNVIARSEYDEESGNLLGMKFFDADGNITRLNSGYAETKMWDYDGNGNAGAFAYFGPDGKPTFPQKWLPQIYRAVMTSAATEIEERYFGPDNQPILSKGGYYLWKAGYNARGNRVGLGLL